MLQIPQKAEEMEGSIAILSGLITLTHAGYRCADAAHWWIFLL